MAGRVLSSRLWPGYAAIWRWHFYAGLFCIPFVLWLAVTGSIYLFRPQIEAIIDRPYAALAMSGPGASPRAQVEAAVRAVPGSVLHRYQLPETPRQAVQVIVGNGVHETRVYVHPQTLAFLSAVDEDSRPMRVVFRLHGELLMGTTGSRIVELAASWAIVMILSGLYLWWPKGQGLAGVVYPRLGTGRRLWRDLHAVTGFWVSSLALFLLLSGLPWTAGWGSYLAGVRAFVEPPAALQDWSAGRGADLVARTAADAGTRAMMTDHAEHGGMTMAHPGRSYAPLDRLVGVVRPLGLAPPVLIAPPAGRDYVWTAKSDAANRPLRTDLTLDAATGAILSRRDFAGRPLVDRVVGYGVAAHEGQLFGVANQLLGLVTALGLVLLAVSGGVLWWRRRPAGTLGAPPSPAGQPATAGFVAVLLLLAVALPMLGMSMTVVLLADRVVVRRWPRGRRWLGLATGE